MPLFRSRETRQKPPQKAPISGYRADIDGLRAVAVLAVIIFHLNTDWLPGGFIGVDIFFVISGYLITHNICQLMLAGKFSLLDFYGRRAKRIAPALLVVVAAVIGISQLIMLPEHAEKTAESGLWAVASAANIYFWQHLSTDYFARASAETPLLHLWSLGVEEQFYLLWPLALMLFSGLLAKKRAIWLVSIAAFASFALAQGLFDIAHSFSYYMLPTRAGELLVGALAALISIQGVGRHLLSRHPQKLSILGFAVMAWSLIGIEETSVFPGFIALVPTLGTALLILSASYRPTIVATLLAIKPMRFIGLISFSAYLWHWPLFAFYRYGHAEITLIPAIALFTASLLLGWLSYRFVEQPTRRKQWSAPKLIWRYFAIPSTAVAGFALLTMYSDGFGLHALKPAYASQLEASRNVIHTVSRYKDVCQRWLIKEADTQGNNCVLNAPKDMVAEPEILLWGDSNAAHYAGVVGAFARARSQSVRNLSHASCPPLFADPLPFLHPRFRYRAAECKASIELVRSKLADYQVIVIAASYVTYQRHSSKFKAAYLETLSELAATGKDIILMGKAPVFYSYRRDCHARALRYPGLNCDAAAEPLADNIAEFNHTLAAFSERYKNVYYYDINNYLCPNGLCSPYAPDGSSLYYDVSHLSIASSWQLGMQATMQQGLVGAFAPFDKLRGRAIAAQ